MVEKERLIDYFKKYSGRGYSEPVLRKEASRQGWDPKIIDEAWDESNKKDNKIPFIISTILILLLAFALIYLPDKTPTGRVVGSQGDAPAPDEQVPISTEPIIIEEPLVINGGGSTPSTGGAIASTPTDSTSSASTKSGGGSSLSTSSVSTQSASTRKSSGGGGGGGSGGSGGGSGGGGYGPGQDAPADSGFQTEALPGGTLSCRIRDTACQAGEADIMGISNTTNAHAEQPNKSTNYVYRVCCKDTSGLNTISNSSTGTKLFGISDETNAHIEMPNAGNYFNSTYIKASVDTVECIEENVTGSCTQGRTCIVTYNNTDPDNWNTNFHVGNCSSDALYLRTMCCRLTNGTSLFMNFVNITPNRANSSISVAGVWNITNLNGTGENGTTYTWYINGTEAWRDSALLNYWKLDGTGADSTGRNAMTLLNTTNTSGIIKNALSFNGVNSSTRSALDIYSNVTFRNGLTLIAWVKGTPSASNTLRILDIEGAYFLETSTDSKYVFHIDGNAGTFKSAKTADNRWNHVVGTADAAGNIKIYIDGILENSGSQTRYNIDSVSRNTTIGMYSLTNNYFNGTIDEVKIFNRSLSATEVAQEYQMMTYGSTEEEVVNGTPAPDIPLSMWHFDDNTTGTRAEDYFGDHNATLVNGAAFGPGMFGANGAVYDGTNDYVAARPLNLSTGNQMTLEAWVKPRTITGITYMEVMRQDQPAVTQDFIFSFQNSGKNLTFGLNTNTGGYLELQSTANQGMYADGNWHHVVAVYNGSLMMIYKDSQLVANRTKTGTITNTGTIFTIGATYGGAGPDEFFNGTIDEVAVYPRALSREEVNQSYRRGYPLFGLSSTRYGGGTNLTFQVEPAQNDGTFGEAKNSSVLQVENDGILCGQTAFRDTTLISNLSSNGTCFMFNQSNIKLDCAGYTLFGNSTGILLNISTGVTGVVIKNCRLGNASTTIRIANANDTLIYNITGLDGYENISIGTNDTHQWKNVTIAASSNISVEIIGNGTLYGSVENNTNLALSGNGSAYNITFSNNTITYSNLSQTRMYNKFYNNTFTGNSNIFVGNYSVLLNNSFSDGAILDTPGAVNSTIAGNRFRDTSNSDWYPCLKLGSKTISAVLANNTFDNCSVGFDVAGLNNIVSGNTVINTTYYLIRLSSANNTKITNNTFGKGSYIWLQMLSGNFTLIENNTFAQDTGIRIEGQGNDPVSNTIIRNNRFTNTRWAAVDIYHHRSVNTTIESNIINGGALMGGIAFEDAAGPSQANGTIIRSNTFQSLYSALYINYTTKIKGLVFENNNVTSMTYFGVYINVTAPATIQAIPTDSIEIKNNTFNSVPTGIYIELSTNVSITNNTFTSISGTGINLRGVNASIRDNAINTTATGIRISDVKSNISSYFIHNLTIINASSESMRITNTLNVTINETNLTANVTIENITNSYTRLTYVSGVDVTSKSYHLRDFINFTNVTIRVNSTFAPEFNRTAHLRFNSTGFTTPKAKIDAQDTGSFVTCPATICANLSSANGFFTFNVSGFTGYGIGQGAECGTILNEDTNLTGNLTAQGTCFTLNASNITLNCAGFTITGNQSAALLNIQGDTTNEGIVIKNCVLRNYSKAIGTVSTSNLMVLNNNITNGTYGIDISGLLGNLIIENNSFMNNSEYGIYGGYWITGGVVGNRFYGIKNPMAFGGGYYNFTVANNIINISEFGSSGAITFTTQGYSTHNVSILNNTILDPAAEAILTDTISNTLISNNTISAAGTGVVLKATASVRNNTLIADNIIENSTNGIRIYPNFGSKHFVNTFIRGNRIGPLNNYCVFYSGEQGATFALNNTQITGNTLSCQTPIGLPASSTGSQINNLLVKDNILISQGNNAPLALMNIQGLTIDNNTMNTSSTTGTFWGVFIQNSTNASIGNNTFSQSAILIELRKSNASLTDNTFTKLSFTARQVAINFNNTGGLSFGSGGSYYLRNNTFTNILGESLHASNTLNISIDQTNLTANVTLENNTNNYARLTYTVPIDLSSKQYHLADFINFTTTTIRVNSTFAPEFNKTAHLRFNSSSYSAPKAKVDYLDNGTFVNCPATICTNLSTTGGFFTFNVSGFTTYEIEQRTLCGILMSTNTTLDEALAGSGNCFVINTSGVKLDCAGYPITGGKTGELINTTSGLNSIIIQNCILYNTSTAIRLTNITHAAIKDTTINGTTTGIFIDSATNDATVNNNTINNSQTAIRIENSNNTILSNNTITNTTTAFLAGSSLNLTTNTNTITNATTGIQINDTSIGSYLIRSAILSGIRQNSLVIENAPNVTITSTTLPPNVSITNSTGNFSQIMFNQTLTITTATDLSKAINLKNNFVFVNSTLAPALNKTAVVTINATSTTGTAVLVDYGTGALSKCPASICTVLSTVSKKVVFAVRSFSTYQLGNGVDVVNLPPGLTLTDSNGNPVADGEIGALMQLRLANRPLFEFNLTNSTDFQNLNISYNDTAIAIAGWTQIENVTTTHTIYIPNFNANAGTYVCPHAYNLTAMATDCPGVMWYQGPFPQTNQTEAGEVTVEIYGDYYRISGLNQSGSEGFPYKYVKTNATALQPAAATVYNASRFASGEGGASNATSQGGNTSQMDFIGNGSTSKWQGYYGNASGRLVLGQGQYDFYNFTQATPLFVAVTQDQNFNFAGLKAANKTLLDQHFGFNPSDTDSATLTFNDTGKTLGGIGNVPYAPLEGGTWFSGIYDNGTATDLEGDARYYAFGVEINQSETNFFGSTSDFELLVGLNETAGVNTNTVYFFMQIQ